MSRRPYKLPLAPPDASVRGNKDFQQLWLSRCWGIGSIAERHSYSENALALDRWDREMARKTYRIELKIDFQDDTRHAALIEVAKQYARDFLASAMLLQDGRPPAAVLMTDDSFVGMEEVSILEESDNLHTSSGIDTNT